jgi:dTDP-4-amino-4,6-dideoxygalactose transaminase
MLRQYGWEAKYRSVLAGGRNSRLDEIQAAVLRAKLPYLDDWNEQRRDIVKAYARGLAELDLSRPSNLGTDYVAHLYVVSEMSGDNPDLPVTEQLSREILTLPCFPEMTTIEVEQVTEAVRGVLG